MKHALTLSGLITALSGLPALAQDGLETIGKPVDGGMGFQFAATELARDTFALDWLILVIITAICLFVGALVLYIIVRFNRRANPTPFIYYMPSDLLIAGEGRMLERFRATPPDHVVLVHKDTSEFGARFFGRDYGRDLGAWIRRDYRPVARVGSMPLQDERPGMLLLRRRGPDEGDRSLSEIAPRP